MQVGPGRDVRGELVQLGHHQAHDAGELALGRLRSPVQVRSERGSQRSFQPLDVAGKVGRLDAGGRQPSQECPRLENDPNGVWPVAV